MKKTAVIAAVALGIATSSMAVADADGLASYTITFNGQNVDRGNQGTCS